ncbi:MAG: hypothetical protein WCJ51_03085 [Candidatus Moraniibacteriota bacterium]
MLITPQKKRLGKLTRLGGAGMMEDMEKTFSKLQKNILATVVYYDGFAYPLTAFEIWKYLLKTDQATASIPVGLALIVKELQSEFLLKYLESKNGFYFLKGRGELFERRIENQKISAGKLKRLRWVVRWLSLVPFVRMIGATGGLAMKNANQKSDWDLLVVLADGHIWMGRTLITVWAHLLGKRRHQEKIRDRVCLNYFITEQSLEVMTKDLFSANEYFFLLPLFGWEVYHRFQIKNQWIKNLKPNYDLQEIQPVKILADTFWTKAIRMTGEFFLQSAWLENWLKKIEKAKIAQNPKTHQEGSLVYAQDDALVFLPVPHGPVIFEKFKAKLEELGIER